MKHNKYLDLALKIENIGQSYLELLKLKSIHIVSGLGIKLMAGTVVVLLFIPCMVSFNLALALWLGGKLGKLYYGFLIISLAYLLCMVMFAIWLYYFKAKLKHAIIKYLLNIHL